MNMGFAPTWLRQGARSLLHKTTLTTGSSPLSLSKFDMPQHLIQLIFRVS